MSRSSICGHGVNGCGGAAASGVRCFVNHKKRHLSILGWKLREQNMPGGAVEVNKDGCKFGDKPHKLEYNPKKWRQMYPLKARTAYKW